ncbi:hypothetical protein SAMN05421810_103716 [Amycolatopsis arida]|uniref:Uncharacterized protein n=1 Tax=Amycolatopsis arida TaxID=587909 RepID=A0A1I5TYD9_9PSEU|nr:hypothetical protein [Amycolatopsis arida]TDX95909.1 hypothetical protein CLV69_10341 [Amycolatopsis arida]SFP88075.1 hypothetical protein SAMN05421810_103716 [Amycolatopsis arida]
MTEFDDAGLPPRRELPPQVADRIYASVRAGMPTPQRARSRAPLTVAAAVVLLAGGAVAVNTGVDHVPAATEDTATLDRCWSAIEQSGRTAEFPDRGSWQQLFQEQLEATTMTAIRAGTRTVFCETSLTTVSVSAPIDSLESEGDDRVRGLLTTPAGTVVVAGRDIEDMDVRTRDRVLTYDDGPDAYETALMSAARDGVFVGSLATNDLTRVDLVAQPDSRSGLQDTSSPPVPIAPPPPAVFVEDVAAQATYTTEEELALMECLHRPGNGGGPVIDAPTWQAGALLDYEISTEDHRTTRTRTVLAVNARGTMSCQLNPIWGISYFPSPSDPPDNPIRVLSSESRSPGMALSGDIDEGVTTLAISVQGRTVTTEVRNRTFAVFLPDAMGSVPELVQRKAITATAYDAEGEIVFQGPLQH